jgi:hypothetical protein
MSAKRNLGVVVLISILILVFASTVQADDGRINRAPYHFGGDTLYCYENEGCNLLDLNGVELTSWAESAIGAAFTNVELTGQNSLVGDGQGSYGPVQLWAVPTEETNGNKKLCLVGFDEWGKLNDMCFAVTLDNHYQQAALPVNNPVAESASVPDCSMFTVGDFVALISNIAIQGPIDSINIANGTATFGKGTYTYACNLIHEVT